jgi:thymidine phosphorylase
MEPKMSHQTLMLRRMGLDTYHQPVVYMHADCPVCRSQGFAAPSRVEVRHEGRAVVATLQVVTGELLRPGEVGLSEEAWRRLGSREGDELTVTHAPPLEAFAHVRAKMYGHRLDERAFDAIVREISAGWWPDIHISAFLTACAGSRLDVGEMIALTRAMVGAGERLSWGRALVADKHCVGGLPGNRTTPIVVAITAAHGLLIPKTSSRAITSPAGTADVVDTFTRASLSLSEIRRVVEREGGCLAWGGSMGLSPVDDVLIGVEHPLDLDSEGQLVASVLSKKVAAGSTHVLIDLPVGPTAKVRSVEAAAVLARDLGEVGRAVGLQVSVMTTDGSQPVGVGIGPALEAHDVLAVLRGAPGPQDLRERALAVAGRVLELDPGVPAGMGLARARELLESGQAWRKLVAIAEAQGGLREPPVAPLRAPVVAARAGRVQAIDNRRLARVAKLAGAPGAPSAGVRMNKRLGDPVEVGEPLFEVHAETRGELGYALDYVGTRSSVFAVEER